MKRKSQKGRERIWGSPVIAARGLSPWAQTRKTRDPAIGAPEAYVKRPLDDVRRDYEALTSADSPATQRLLVEIQRRDGPRLETVRSAVEDGANVNALIVYDRYDETPLDATSGAARDYLRSVGALTLRQRRAREAALRAEYRELTGEDMPASPGPPSGRPRHPGTHLKYAV